MGETSTMDQQSEEDRLRFARGTETRRRLRTVMAVCLDESGSMGMRDADGASKKTAAMEAFNAYLQDQQALDVDECLMNLVKFNTHARLAQATVPIRQIVPLRNDTYLPSGGTALFDAIAYAVGEAEKAPADRYVVVILTDGEENSSRETTLEQIRALISSKEAEGNWTFTYLSAHADAFGQAQSYGISVGNTATYTPTAGGTYTAAQHMSHSMGGFRSRGMAQSTSFYVDPTVTITPDPHTVVICNDEDDQP